MPDLLAPVLVCRLKGEGDQKPSWDDGVPRSYRDAKKGGAMCGEADEPGGVGMCTRVGAATKLMSFTRDALRRCSGAQSAKPALGRAGGKAEQTAAVPAWVPWMGVLCRRSGQTQWMRGGGTGCVSQWLLCRGEGVTCNGHEAERSAQADRGARGGVP